MPRQNLCPRQAARPRSSSCSQVTSARLWQSGGVERRVNLGVLVFAALLLDVLLWLFVLAGWESSSSRPTLPAPISRSLFSPDSHGLPRSHRVVNAGWLGRARVVSPRQKAKWRVAACIALAVFSHWLLDALVHVPELPLTGEQSLKVGLGLWGRMPVALAVEALITVLGLGLFLAAVPASTRGRKLGARHAVVVTL